MREGRCGGGSSGRGRKGAGGAGGGCQVRQNPLGSLIKFSTFPHSH